MADVSAIIRADAPLYGLDPLAVLADASGEGGFDSTAPGHFDPDTHGATGWSYGPFQLRSPGALPIASEGPAGPGELYAWSRVGIDYALQRMAAVGARGQRGPQAIDTIVRYFERPAHPDAEIQRDVAWYQAHGGSMSAGASSQNASLVPGGVFGPLLPGGPTPGGTDIGGAITGALVGPFKDAADIIAKPFRTVADFFTSVYDIATSSNTWIRVAFFVGGGVLIVGGLKYALAGSGSGLPPVPPV